MKENMYSLQLELARVEGLIETVGEPAPMPPRETAWALNAAYEFAASLMCSSDRNLSKP